MKKFIVHLKLLLNDLLFIGGCIFILLAAYRVNTNIGLFLTGVFFMFYAYLLSSHARQKER
ncbi:hypothetical protein [Bacillus pumilus]|uniref:hypothetical protein n=1 Tax=Bacillus pumilus TaxID=1408 RepID=UPI0011A8D1EA|nr:hypothetical protein [Bacillus pumilus]